MPRKDEPKTEEVEKQEVAPVLQDFFFPSIGDGTTIRAASLEDAQEQAKKLRESLQ